MSKNRFLLVFWFEVTWRHICLVCATIRLEPWLFLF